MVYVNTLIDININLYTHVSKFVLQYSSTFYPFEEGTHDAWYQMAPETTMHVCLLFKNKMKSKILFNILSLSFSIIEKYWCSFFEVNF